MFAQKNAQSILSCVVFILKFDAPVHVKSHHLHTADMLSCARGHINEKTTQFLNEDSATSPLVKNRLIIIFIILLRPSP